MSEPIIIVSNDGHMSAPLPTYKKYMESKYHDALDELEKENDWYKEINKKLSIYDSGVADDSEGDPFSPERQAAGYDVKARLHELDGQGVACDIVFEGAQFTTAPWFNMQNAPYSPELREVGSRAYHRWMADCIVEADGRLAGIAEPGPCLDMNATIKELKWLAENGFVGVQCPGVIADPNLPGLHDKYFDPFWAACTDLGLQILVHGGWGMPQGEMAKFMEHLDKEISANGDAGLMTDSIDRMDDADKMSVLEAPKRAIWQLLLSGVFDRHPKLQIIPTETHADWIPGMLSFLDRFYDSSDSLAKALDRKPSEYWGTNLYAGVTFARPAELACRHQLGVDRMLFGMDYPHAEGTWPNNLDWIRAAFKGIPESEARPILGENAIRVYGLDREKLKAVAKRIGPKPEEVLGDQFVKPELIQHFNRRCGFLKPAEPFKEAMWGPLIAKEVDRIALAQTA